MEKTESCPALPVVNLQTEFRPSHSLRPRQDHSSRHSERSEESLADFPFIRPILPPHPPDHPQKQAQPHTEHNAGRNRKIKRRVLALVDDVSRQVSQTER